MVTAQPELGILTEQICQPKITPESLRMYANWPL